jgi:sugar phosphate isomerase/epimerase
MKIALSTKILQYLHFRDSLEVARRYGYEGVELDRLPQMAPGMFKAMTDAYGLAICSIQSEAHVARGTNIASGNADKRHAGSVETERTIDFAAKCGCPIVQIKGMYCWPYSSPYRAFWERARAGLKRLCARAEAGGVRLALHFKHSVAYLINSPWAGIHMIEEVGSPALGVTFDTGTLNLMTRHATSLVGFAEILAPYVCHVHVSDNDGMTDQRLAPGGGSIEWRVLLGRLRELGYDGYLSVDLHGGFQQRDPHGQAYRSIAFLRSVLREVEAMPVGLQVAGRAAGHQAGSSGGDEGQGPGGSGVSGQKGV